MSIWDWTQDPGVTSYAFVSPLEKQIAQIAAMLPTLRSIDPQRLTAQFDRAKLVDPLMECLKYYFGNEKVLGWFKMGPWLPPEGIV
jgi:hypothetical protein